MKRKEGIVGLGGHAALVRFMRNFPHYWGAGGLGSEKIIRSYMLVIVLTLINGVNLGRRLAASFKNDICTPCNADSDFVICVMNKKCYLIRMLSRMCTINRG